MLLKRLALLCPLLLITASCAAPQTTHVYVGHIEPRAVLLAWGTTTGSGNTIGRAAAPLGKAEVRVGEQRTQTDKSYATLTGLEPDTQYDYEVRINDRSIGKGRVRTYPERADKVAFIVIGDWGDAGSGQRRIAERMAEEIDRREKGDKPIRFVLTTGDNVYASVNLGLRVTNSGDQDDRWGPTFFRPYAKVIDRVPFVPSIGNHDGNSSENRADLLVYLDNFFFPLDKPARYYQFSYGGLVDFFALDSSTNSETGPPAPMFAENSDQHRWLQKQVCDSQAPWKIPFFHHPPFNAGPRHAPAYGPLRHFMDVFQRCGVRAVFNGHEHNLQFSKVNAETGNILYTITGSGGKLRSGDITRALDAAQMAAFAPQHQFLVVEIENRTMTITPLSYQRLNIRDGQGKPFPVPVTLSLP